MGGTSGSPLDPSPRASGGGGGGSASEAQQDVALDVAPPIPRAVAGRLLADDVSDDGHSAYGSDDDSYFGSDVEGVLTAGTDQRFSLQAANEIEVSAAEFEWLASGTLPGPPPRPWRAGWGQAADCGAHEGPGAAPRAGCGDCVTASAAAAAAAAAATKARRSTVASSGGVPGLPPPAWCPPWCGSAPRAAAARWAAARRRAARARAERAAARQERHVLFDPLKEAAATRAFRGVSIFGLPLVHPGSLISRLEGFVISFLDSTYSAFLVPIVISFVGEEEWAYWSPYAILDCAVGVAFTADILFSFHRPAIVRHNFRRRLLADGRLVARAYVFHSHALLDVLTVAPFWIQVFLIVFHYAGAPQAINVLLALRILRLLRVLPVIGRMFDLTASDLGRSLMGVFSVAVLYLATMTYVAAVLVNLLACVWFFTARQEGGLPAGKGGTGAKTWMSEVDVSGTSLPDAGPINQYIASAYFAITTLTTVGYGDITAQTAVEMGVAAAIMFAGILFFGFVVNSMGATLESSSAAARRGKALRGKFDEVEAWMHSRRLPLGLRRRILEYYSEVWVRAAEWRERDLYKELPPSLRSEVTRTLALDVFRSSDIFCAAPEPLLHETASGMTPVSIFPGFDLCEQGEPADGLWIMHEGELLLLRDGVPVDVVKAPAILGESVILADRVPEASRRVVTMRAIELCTLWHLPQPRLAMLLDRCPQISEAIESDFKAQIRKYAARGGGGGSSGHLDDGGGGGGGGGSGGRAPTSAKAGLADLLHRLEDVAARAAGSVPDGPVLRRRLSLARRSSGPGGLGRTESGAAASDALTSSLLAAEDAEAFVSGPAAASVGGGGGEHRPSHEAAAPPSPGGEPAAGALGATRLGRSVRPNIFARLSSRFNSDGGGGPGPTPRPSAAPVPAQRTPPPPPQQPRPPRRSDTAHLRALASRRDASTSDRAAAANVLVAEFARSLPHARVRHAARVAGASVPPPHAPLPPAARAAPGPAGGGGGGPAGARGGGGGASPGLDPFRAESLAEEMVRMAAEDAPAAAAGAVVGRGGRAR